ncbi:MAG: adenylate/guanylate cyclase domain-containing protein [Pseudanabaenaceae cyanobacterium bins.39]|nr:adenylate/guanylate cyclase domain-containing protein [Pseudanabaenaceae cyanobacterium bins.39]
MPITLKKRFWKWRGLLVIPANIVILYALRMIGLLQPLELAAYDLFFQWRSPEAPDERIAIVEITERDLRKYSAPIPDVILAQLIARIKQQQPRVIGLDIYRDLPIPIQGGAGHEALIKEFTSTSNLYGIRTVVGYKSDVSAPPALEQLNRVTANDLIPDRDSKIRRIILSLRDAQDNPINSLSAVLATQYLEAENIQWEAVDPELHTYQLGKATLVPFASHDGGYINADAGGFQILANYRSFQNAFRTATLTDVLEGNIATDFFRDRVVLIGNTSQSGNDFHPTPFSNKIFGNSLDLENGVTIHANFISQILSSAIDGRSTLKVWTDLMEWLWISLWTIAGGLICWRRRYARPMSQTKKLIHRLPWAFLTIPLLGVVLVVGSYGAFLQGWWIPVVPTFLGLFGSAIAVTGYTARGANEIRQIFGRYVTDEVVANLLETPEGLNLGGEKRKVTILFSDLRGFSALFERITPEQGVQEISLYLDAMTAIVAEYQGTVNEFIGDGMMVIFGAPIQREDDTQRAVTCAIAMQLEMQTVNTKLNNMQLPSLEMGIGIHTGEVLAGNIGSHRRAKYTVMGSTVNLASRVESYTVGGQVLISEAVLDEVKSMVRIDGQIHVHPKGFHESINIFDVGGINHLALPEDKETLVRLANPIAIKWNVLEGKHVTEEKWVGSLLELSAHNAKMHSDRPLVLLTNLEFNVIAEEQGISMENIYGKVVEISTKDPCYGWLRFTAVPPNVAEWFYNLRQVSSL